MVGCHGGGCLNVDLQTAYCLNPSNNTPSDQRLDSKDGTRTQPLFFFCVCFYVSVFVFPVAHQDLSIIAVESTPDHLLPEGSGSTIRDS